MNRERPEPYSNIQIQHESYLEERRTALFYIGKFVSKIIWGIFAYSFTLSSIILLILNNGKSCDKPLYDWLIFATILFTTQSIISTYFKLFHNEDDENTRSMIRIRILQNLLFVLFFILFIIFCSYLLTTNTCKRDMYQVYTFLLSYTIIIIIIFGPFLAAFVIFLLMFCITLPCSTQFENLLNNILNIFPQNPASKEDLEKLSVYIYDIHSNEGILKYGIIEGVSNFKAKSVKYIQDPICCICLEDYKHNDLLRFLPCIDQHNFHLNCIDKWLKINKRCPLCRKDITLNYNIV